MEHHDGPTQERQSSGESIAENDPRRLGSSGRESQALRFSGAGGITTGRSSWSSCALNRGSAGDPPGGIGSRLITKLLEQRAEVLSRYAVVMQRKAEYEAKLEQIDREIEEAQALLMDALQRDLQDL